MTTALSARPAALWKRIVAGAIDFLIIYAICWPLLKMLIFGTIEGMLRAGWFGMYAWFLFGLVILIIPFAFHDVRGKGFGKWLMGMKVADAADPSRPPTWPQLFKRNLTLWVVPVGMAMAYGHPDKMRLGDRLAGTVVIEDPPDPTSSPFMRRFFKVALTVGLLAGCGLWVGWGMMRFAQDSQVYQVAIDCLLKLQPVRDIARVTSPSQLQLTVAQPGFTPEHLPGVVLQFSHDADNMALRAMVFCEGNPKTVTPWQVKEVQGSISFRPGLDGKERIYVFLPTKHLDRFLTQEEITKLREKVPPEQVIPELKPATDNETRKTAPGPSRTVPDNAPRPPADNATGKAPK